MVSVWLHNSSQKIWVIAFIPLPNAGKDIICAPLLIKRRFPAHWNCSPNRKDLARSLTISIPHMKLSTWENTEIIEDISVSPLPRVQYLFIQNIVKIVLLQPVG
jgi:hypothetical protein